MPKNKYTKEDAALETLLELNGEVFPMDNGYWTKFEAYKIKPIITDFWEAVDEILK